MNCSSMNVKLGVWVASKPVAVGLLGEVWVGALESGAGPVTSAVEMKPDGHLTRAGLDLHHKPVTTL